MTFENHISTAFTFQQIFTSKCISSRLCVSLSAISSFYRSCECKYIFVPLLICTVPQPVLQSPFQNYFVWSDKYLAKKCVKSMDSVLYTQTICWISRVVNKDRSHWAVEMPNVSCQNQQVPSYSVSFVLKARDY